MTREQVIKGLECCNMPNNHDDCPYNGAAHYNICTHQLLADAIALLKAQEPRVLTLEEVKKFGLYGNGNMPPYLYCENRRDEDKWLSCIPILGRVNNMGIFGKYGEDWRCWNARPTDEQREAVKWE